MHNNVYMCNHVMVVEYKTSNSTTCISRRKKNTTKINMKMILLVHLLVCFMSTTDSRSCIRTYNQLKSDLRDNSTGTDNIHRLMSAFYPPNKSTTHTIFVHYCVRNTSVVNKDPAVDDDDIDDDIDYNECNQTFTDYKFQWLANSLPLLTDSDVLQANTFFFAAIKDLNLSLTIDPFCDDTDGLALLETLTVWVCIDI